jgi:hypothetical protein
MCRDRFGWCPRFTSPEGRGRIASSDAIRVRRFRPSWDLSPVTRIASQFDLSPPLGRGELSTPISTDLALRLVSMPATIAAHSFTVP